MRNKVILIGGFKKTMALANALVNKNYSVTVINNNYEDCVRLAENSKLKVIYGDGTKAFILGDAAIHENDIAIALTKRDEDNLVICELCKKKFGVKKTVSLVNDTKKMEFFYQMGIDSVVCASNIITGILEQQAFIDDVTSVLSIGRTNLSVSEVRIMESSPSVNKMIWELNLPKDVTIGCILRNEHNMVPKGDTKILAGDVIVLISLEDKQLDAISELTGR